MSTITQFPSGNTLYRIEFDYLARTFVVVTLVNSSNPALNRVLEVGRDYRFLNPMMIEMLVDQSGFDIVRIHRQTGTDLVVDFRNGSVLTASDLTNSELQAIHIAEEGRDQTVDLAKEYADAASNSAGNAKDSEDEARRIAESIKASGKIGYITRRSFEKGFNVQTWNEALLWEEDGDYYRWDGTLPKNVPAGSTPETSGGIGLGGWVSVGDASLRSDLIKTDGEKYIGVCPDISTLRTIEPSFVGQNITVRGYYSDTPGLGGGTFIAFSSSEADDGVNIFVTTGGKRWKRAGSHIDIPVENGGMMASRTAEQNSEALERIHSCLPQTGGKLRFSDFYDIKYGAICPPRVMWEGIGRDSCGLRRTGNDIKTVPDRIWQGAPHSFSLDFIAAVDMDSSVAGDLTGNFSRSVNITGMSLIGAATAKNAYGIYSAISYMVRLEDLYIENVMTGYRTSDSWLQVFDSLLIKDVQDGISVDTGGTTFNLNNVYVRNVSRWAYKFTNITYSNLKGCAADYVTGSAYVFLGCTSVVMDGCGAEEIHGSFFECNSSRLAINGFRGVNLVDTGVVACIFTQCGVTITASYLPEFSGSHTSKYWQVNDTTISLVNTVAPAASRVLWAATVSRFNYSDWGGNYTIWGTSAWTATGYLINGIAHIYGDNSPDSSVTQFGVGARWELVKPIAGQPYKWVHVGSGVWKVAGNVSA